MKIDSTQALSTLIRDNYRFMKHVQYLFYCIRVQMILVLMEHRVPISYLFFNVFENLDHIYNHLFNRKLNRFFYITESLSPDSFSLLNVHYKRLSFHSFEEMDSFLMDHCAKHRYSIMFMDNKSLTYRKGYPEHPSWHSITIRDLHEQGYVISDNEPVFVGPISKEHLKTGFEKLPENIRFIHYLEIPEQIQVNKDEILSQFRLWIQKFDDDFSFYQKVIDETQHPTIQDEQERFWILRQAFTMIAGSRYCFRQFLQLTNCDRSILDALDQCIQIAENTKNVCIKSSLTGVFDAEKFQNYSLSCKELDQKVYRYLKTYGEDLVLIDEKELNNELI